MRNWKAILVLVALVGCLGVMGAKMSQVPPAAAQARPTVPPVQPTGMPARPTPVPPTAVPPTAAPPSESPPPSSGGEDAAPAPESPLLPASGAARQTGTVVIAVVLGLAGAVLLGLGRRANDSHRTHRNEPDVGRSKR
jgi:hypothetical protein